MSNVCDIQEIQFTKPFSGDNGHDKSNSSKGIEFILIGSDGVWDGGDYWVIMLSRMLRKNWIPILYSHRKNINVIMNNSSLKLK